MGWHGIQGVSTAIDLDNDGNVAWDRRHLEREESQDEENSIRKSKA